MCVRECKEPLDGRSTLSASSSSSTRWKTSPEKDPVRIVFKGITSVTVTTNEALAKVKHDDDPLTTIFFEVKSQKIELYFEKKLEWKCSCCRLTCKRGSMRKMEKVIPSRIHTRINFFEDLSFEQLLFQAHQMSRFSLFESFCCRVPPLFLFFFFLKKYRQIGGGGSSFLY